MQSTTLHIDNTLTGVTIIYLNRPEANNALNPLMINELTQVLEKINNEPATKVVVLAAKGKNFCAGADLKAMQVMANASYEDNLNDAKKLAQLLQILNTLKKPTLALVQGLVFGGGIGLIACCDIAIASSETKLCFSETKLGLIPAVISPYIITAMGERAARRYFLTAEPFTANEAYRLGLIHDCIPESELWAVGKKIIHLLLNNGPKAITAAKQLIRHVVKQTINEDLITTTIKCIADIRATVEAQEGIAAFLEKRHPNFSE